MGFRDPRKTLEAVARPRPFGAGDDIVKSGESGAGVFVITEGEVEVLHVGRRVNTLRRGDHLGEMAVLDEFPRSATVRGLTAGNSLALFRWDFVGIVKGDADLAIHLVQTLSKRLREADEKLQSDRRAAVIVPSPVQM